jgi:hypothetical protein
MKHLCRAVLAAGWLFCRLGAWLISGFGLTGIQRVTPPRLAPATDKHGQSGKELIVELSILPRALLALLLCTVSISAHAKEMVLTCTNPSSGTAWDVKIDFDRRMADSFPAEITDQSITWQDPQRQGIYEFDRASGDMTMRGPSSTGGYFLYYHCRAD